MVNFYIFLIRFKGLFDLNHAIITAKGLGIYKSLDEAVTGMVQIKETFEPDRENVKIYEELYSRVYAKMYKALEPLYSQIREITGYPK